MAATEMRQYQSKKLPMAALSSLAIQNPMELAVAMFTRSKPMLMVTSCGRRPSVVPIAIPQDQSNKLLMAATSLPE